MVSYSVAKMASLKVAEWVLEMAVRMADILVAKLGFCQVVSLVDRMDVKTVDRKAAWSVVEMGAKWLAVMVALLVGPMVEKSDSEMAACWA
jgi:hypothetical protein